MRTSETQSFFLRSIVSQTVLWRAKFEGISYFEEGEGILIISSPPSSLR